MLSKIDTHAADAAARIGQEYKASPRICGVIATHAGQIQELDDALWQLATERYLDVTVDSVYYEAVGIQLDVIGSILAESRGAMTDDEYRLVLKAKIRLIKSSGTVEELVAIFHALFPLATITVTTRPPAYVSVHVSGVITATEGAIGRRMCRQGRAAGVHGSFRWQEDATAALFTLDTGPGLDVGHLAGSGV